MFLGLVLCNLFLTIEFYFYFLYGVLKGLKQGMFESFGACDVLEGNYVVMFDLNYCVYFISFKVYVIYAHLK